MSTPIADLQISTEIEELLVTITDLYEKSYEELKELIPLGFNVVNNYIVKIRTVLKRVILANNSGQLTPLFFKMYGTQLEHLRIILSVCHYNTIEYIEMCSVKCVA